MLRTPATDAAFCGRWTVPALWDREAQRIVDNPGNDICRMPDDEFPAPHDRARLVNG